MTTQPTDERDNREGLPSASSMDKFAKCPGSWAAERGMTELPMLAVTQAGTDIHEAMESDEDENLDVSEKEITERLREMRERETINFKAYYNTPHEAKIIVEERFWIRNRRTLELLSSARPDYCCVPGDGNFAALVINWKTGYKKPTPSELSWQSRTEVISLWHQFPKLKIIRGAFASSRLSTEWDSTDYTLEDLERIEMELFHVVWRTKQPHAERVPGPHCRYCRANGICREKAVYDLIIASYVPIVDGKPDQLAVLESVGKLMPKEMGFLYDRKLSVTTGYDNLKARMLALPDDVLAEAGHKKGPGNQNKVIVDVPTAFLRLGKLLTDAERAQCIKIVRGPAAEILAEKENITKKTAGERILEALGDTVVDKPGNPKLVKL